MLTSLKGRGGHLFKRSRVPGTSAVFISSTFSIQIKTTLKNGKNTPASPHTVSFLDVVPLSPRPAVDSGVVRGAEDGGGPGRIST